MSNEVSIFQNDLPVEQRAPQELSELAKSLIGNRTVYTNRRIVVRKGTFRKMLNGEEVPGCERCYKHEKNGSESHRTLWHRYFPPIENPTETQNVDIEERAVRAFEKIGTSLENIQDWMYELDTKGWSERMEWYLNEFYMIAKAKTIGNTGRPDKSTERPQ